MELATEVKSDLMSLDKAGLVPLLPCLLKKPEKAVLGSRQEAAVRILVTEAARQGTNNQVLIWLSLGKATLWLRNWLQCWTKLAWTVMLLKR